MWYWDESVNVDFMLQIDMWFLLVKLNLIEFEV